MATLDKLYNDFSLKKSRRIIYEKTEKIEEIISIPHKPLNNESTNKIKTICDFSFQEELGEGTFGTVKLAINKQTGEKVAIKILEKKKILEFEDRKRVEREIKILKCLRHPNIVHLYSVLQTKENLYIIMEYAKGIELFDYIAKKKRIDELTACHIYQQIISGLEYLHKNNIVHRDIKPENLIINKKTKELKIVDFGLSNIFNNDKKRLLSSSCGSPSYAAPEMLQGHKYRPQPVDIWSSGIVLFAMICGYLPFEDVNNDLLYKKICIGKFTIPEHVSNNCKDLLKKILVTEPHKRITIKQIKNHPWFKIYNNKGNLILYEGLFIDKYIIPVDEEIVERISNQMNIDIEKIRYSILNNKHDDISTLYYLFLLKKINSGMKSVADLKSDLFREYIKDKNNILNNDSYCFNNKKLNQSGKEITKNIHNKTKNNLLINNDENKKLYDDKKRPVSYGEFNYKNTLNLTSRRITDNDNFDRNTYRITDSRYNMRQIIKPKNFNLDDDNINSNNNDFNEEKENKPKFENKKTFKKEKNIVNKDNKKKIKQNNPKDNNEKLEEILSVLKSQIKSKYLLKKSKFEDNDESNYLEKNNTETKDYNNTFNFTMNNFDHFGIKEEHHLSNKNLNINKSIKKKFNTTTKNNNNKNFEYKIQERYDSDDKKISNFENSIKEINLNNEISNNLLKKKENDNSNINLKKKPKNNEYFTHILSNRKKIFNTIDFIEEEFQELFDKIDNDKKFNKNKKFPIKIENKLMTSKINKEKGEEKTYKNNISYNFKKSKNNNINIDNTILNETFPLNNNIKKSKYNISIIKPRKEIYLNNSLKSKHKNSLKNYKNKYINSASNPKSPPKINKSCIDINSDNGKILSQNYNAMKYKEIKSQTTNKNYLKTIKEKKNKSSNSNNRKNEKCSKKNIKNRITRDNKNVSSNLNFYPNNYVNINKNSFDKLKLQLNISFNNKGDEINRKNVFSYKNTEDSCLEPIKTINEEKYPKKNSFEPFPLCNMFITNRYKLKIEIDNILEELKLKYKNNGFTYLIFNDKNDKISIKIKSLYSPSVNIIQFNNKGGVKYFFSNVINKIISKIKNT